VFRVRKIYILCVGYHCGHDDGGYPFDGQPPEGFDSVVDSSATKTGASTSTARAMRANTSMPSCRVAWDFPIGGYRPAQKWLKDRKGRALSWDDIRHYQKIIKILAETDKIMRGIEMPLGHES
jgi:hypothetical protein